MMTNLFSIFDPSTPNFASANWTSTFLFIMFIPPGLWLASSRIQSILTSLTSYLFSEFSPLIKKSPYLLSFCLSLFILVMFNNVLGLFPYIFTSSAHLTFTLSLALPSWLALMLFGWLNNTSNLLTHLIPQGTPTALMPFMVLIETVSNLIRPATLAVRLTANMVAGHLLTTLLSSATPLTPFSLAPILVGAQVALALLESAVAFIQAYVFSVLVTLYAAEATA